MSSLTVYANEPVTRGKVVVHTSIGPLDIELWPKEAPMACRNFVQLCLEGYYDGCIFHRVIRDFMAQTGDPTGTGKGGESVFGSKFKDEFHSRLRFTHRGLIAMASEGPDTNGSQFFVTLDRCEWLDRKHTIFGKVTGNSLYNLHRFNELEVDAADRPEFAPRIERELEKQRARFLQKKRESVGLDRKQREKATLAKLAAFNSRGLSHKLDFRAGQAPKMAEAASSFDSFDPLRHGTHEGRAIQKIREREKAMLSMSGNYADDEPR